MYDGYYIYSPTYVPQTITDSGTSLKNNATGGNIDSIEQGNGKQLFYYEKGPEGKKITNSAIQTINGVETVGVPIYEAKDGEGQQETFLFSTSKNNIVETKKITIKFTTDRNKAKTTYKHVLKTFVPYTTNYTKDGTNYVINYTLDNYIRIYKDDEAWEGYIITEYGDETKYNVPVNSTTVTFDGTTIEPEILNENIPVINSEGNIEIKNYTYIYNSNNDKRYYENEAGENKGKFFTINNQYEKVYLPDAEVNNSLAEYKKILIRPENNKPNYIELYQLLNKKDENIWYYKDNNAKYNRYSNYQPTIDKNKDCSAINYYVENYLFNFWLNDERLNTNEIMSQKKQSIIDNVNRNLNLAISNYSANSKINYTIPELSEEDWEQALSNISMITFFQGVKVGLKTYNNYSIVTSSENNEFIGEDSLYYIENGGNSYHRYGCNKGKGTDAYLNTDFKVSNYLIKGENDTKEINYYYKHTNTTTPETNKALEPCFYCITNRNIIEKIGNETTFRDTQNRVLARERYIQMSKNNLAKGQSETQSGPGIWYTVTLDANGGTCSTEKIRVMYQGSYGNLPIPKLEGNRFLGWYTSDNTKIENGTRVTITQDHTLYAKWEKIQCSITFDTNGGTAINSLTVDYGTQITLPNPTKEGAEFAGWELYGTTSIYNASDNYVVKSNVTFRAVWTVNIYTVNYNANGGSGAPDSQTKKYGDSLTLSSNVPTRTGHTFQGWAKNSTATIAEYQAGDIYNENSDVTLYAVWQINKYKISYNANGGANAPKTQYKEYGKDLILSNDKPTKSGYTFKGWAIRSTATNADYQAGATYKKDSDLNLYAIWTADTYTVNYDANGGSGAPSKQTKVYGKTLTLSSKEPTRTGYTFQGWAEEKNATTAKYKAGGAYTDNKTITLYAVWQIVDVTGIEMGIPWRTWIPTKAYGNQTNYVDLSASVQPTNAANQTIIWSSSNESIAKVNTEGRVTSVNAGKVTITATSDGNKQKKVTVDIYVYNAAYDWNQERALFNGSGNQRSEKFPAGNDYLILAATWSQAPSNNQSGFSYYKICYSKNNSKFNSGINGQYYFFKTNYQNGKNLCKTYWDADSIASY